jgi:CxxC-x17-CxxC domain-containing protein
LKKEDSMTQGEQTQPKVRVVKSGSGGVRSGVIAVHDENGKVFYRCDCDRCNQSARLPFRPNKDREVLCNECMRTLRQAKPSTRAVRRKGRPAHYFTECDLCGDVAKTTFVPKTGRDFLCNECMKAERADTPEETRDDRPAEEAQPVPEPTEPAAASAAPAVEEQPASVPCGDCGKVMQLRFTPRTGQRLLCPECFSAREQASEKRKAEAAERKKTPSNTRIIFNIECARCGKKETVNFVPKRRDEAMCSTCFDEMYGRK